MRLSSALAVVLAGAACEVVAAPQPLGRRGPTPIRGAGVDLTRISISRNAQGISARQNIQEDDGHYWFATVSLGSQSRTYQLLVDTGSPDLVFADGVDRSDPTISTRNVSCVESYGFDSGSTKGTIYSGPYSFDGNNIVGRFCVASSQTGLRGAQDGFVGLSLIPQSGGSTVASKTGNNIVTAAGWTSFGIYYSNSAEGGPGQLTPNGADPSYYQGEAYWQYETVLPSAMDGEQAYKGYWQFGYNGWSFGSANGTPLVGLGFIDSGNPTINLDSQAVTAIYDQLNTQGAGLPPPSRRMPAIDCSFKGGGPDLSFTFASGNTYTISSSTYVLQFGDTCTVAIIEVGDNTRPNVMGEPFIQQYYTWFDKQDLVLGFNPSVG